MATYLNDLEAVIDAELEELQNQLDGEGVGETHAPGFYSEIGRKPGETQPQFYSRIGKKGSKKRKESGAEESDDVEPGQAEEQNGSSAESTPARPRTALEIRAMSARINRLDQLKKWMRDDPDLFHILDITIGNQVKAAEERQQQQAKAAERRQRIFSIIGAVATLIIGWLLSLVGTPATLFGR